MSSTNDLDYILENLDKLLGSGGGRGVDATIRRQQISNSRGSAVSGLSLDRIYENVEIDPSANESIYENTPISTSALHSTSSNNQLSSSLDSYGGFTYDSLMDYDSTIKRNNQNVYAVMSESHQRSSDLTNGLTLSLDYERMEDEDAYMAPTPIAMQSNFNISSPTLLPYRQSGGSIPSNSPKFSPLITPSGSRKSLTSLENKQANNTTWYRHSGESDASTPVASNNNTTVKERQAQLAAKFNPSKQVQRHGSIAAIPYFQYSYHEDGFTKKLSLNESQSRPTEESRTSAVQMPLPFPRQQLLDDDDTLKSSSTTIKRHASVLNEGEKREFLRSQSQLMSQQRKTKQMILNVHNPDRSYRTIIVSESMLARDVCEILLLKNHKEHSINCQLVEILVNFGLYREIEDHECVTKLFENWPADSNNRFLFKENSKKYEIFQNRTVFVSGKEANSPNTSDNKAEQAKEMLMKEMIMNTDRMADLSGMLLVKEGKKKWKNLFCFLRPIGIYYSKRGTSKDPKHLNLLIEFSEVNMFKCHDDAIGKKSYYPPTPELLVFVNLKRPTVNDHICICAPDRPTRLSWQQGIRLAKFGVDIIRNNYRIAVKRHEKLKKLKSTEPFDSLTKASSSSATAATSSTEQEESSNGIKEVQEIWFKGDLTSEEAEKLLLTSLAYPGTFLVRNDDGKLYLSVLHGNEVIHKEIKRMNVQFQWFLTIDDGENNFQTLKELVDYHHKNKETLPVCLSQTVTE